MPVIGFDPKERLLAKARRYIDCPDAYLAEAEQATSLLLRALRVADSQLRLRIELLLSAFGDKRKLVEPLLAIVRAPEESTESRHNAAIELSVIAEHLDDAHDLALQLCRDAESADAELRLHATTALGWRGNAAAALTLIERLHDVDGRVQEAAVASFTNLRDDRVLGTLLDRLEQGTREQQRAILFNLWRFHRRRADAAQVYLRYVRHGDPDLRYQALVLLGRVVDVADHIGVYEERLADSDPRVRQVALEALTDVAATRLRPIRGAIAACIDDPSMDVKRLALALANKLGR